MKILNALILLLFTTAVFGQKFHTEFEYEILPNQTITIQNSYPKGGQGYTDINGNKYVYVVFWSCITNNSVSDIELNVNISANSFSIPSSPTLDFKLFLPNEEMTLDKDGLQNYGLDLSEFLNSNINSPSNIKKIIKKNESQLFYTVVLSNEGVDGVIRAGFKLKEKELFYDLNGYDISCGNISIRK